MAQNVKVPPLDEAPVTVVGSTPQSVFPFDFPFWEADDLIVSIDGLELASSAFTVQGYYVQNGDAVEGGYGSGAVTLNSAVSNCSVTIDRLVVASRESQFSRAAPLGMPSLNSDLNKLTARQQDLARILSRALLAPVGENVPSAQDVIDAATAISNRMLTSGANVSNADTFKSNAQIVPFKPGPATPINGSRMAADQVLQIGADNPLLQGGGWTGPVYAGTVVSKTFAGFTASVDVPAPAFLATAFTNGTGPRVCGVGLMSIATANGTNDCVFGANFIAANTLLSPSARLICVENDIQFAPGSTPPAGCALMYGNLFGAHINGSAFQLNAHSGSYGNLLKLGGGRATSVGISLNGDEELLDSLLNTTVGTFTTAAIDIGNGKKRGMRLKGPGTTHGALYVDGSGFTHFELADSALVIQDSGGFNSTLTISNSALGVGKNADIFAGFRQDLAADVATEGTGLLRLKASDTSITAQVYVARGTVGNAAATAMRISANSATGRSINAGGTVNASGADYAEYERKNRRMLLAGSSFLKGDVVGFDEEGHLTDRWDEAVSFGIKSTRPALVGGDEVFEGLPEAPTPPVLNLPLYEGEPDPGPNPPEPKSREDAGLARMAFKRRGAGLSAAAKADGRELTEEEIRADPECAAAMADLERISAEITAEGETLEADWRAAVERRKVDVQAHKAAVQAAKDLFENAVMPAWQSEMDAWSAVMDEARAPFDRIAYAGKVPVNVQGAIVGQYLIPAETPDGGITAQAVNAADMTPGQSLTLLGRVRRVLVDGRPEIAVRVS